LENATFSGKNSVGFGASFTGSIKIGYGTTIGPFNFLVGPITIGNYCQLGPAVGIYGKDHPTTHATSYFNQTLFDGRLKKHAIAQDVLIGDGVWIGHGAVVLKGVRIGRGAVIGAGAVVTSEVQDYAIVAGNPARVLRMRFDEEVAEMLTQTQWWLKSGEDLKPYEELFHVDFNENRQKGVEILKQMIQLANSNCGAASKARPTETI
jgi:virginiamycin A acetyltransferase